MITPIDELGLPAVVHDLARRPRGLVLVTGPTGSGKSTSLYCFLSSINAVSRRIITSHGGHLWASPNAGRGAIFQFTLPVAATLPSRVAS